MHLAAERHPHRESRLLLNMLTPRAPLAPSTAASPPWPGAILALDGVTHAYRGPSRDVFAVNDVSLAIGPVEFVAVVGPSGCGKSTLLRIASGLVQPTAGSAVFGTDKLAGPRPEIGMIFQDAVLLPWFTVLENVVLPQRIARRSLPAARTQAREMLHAVGLGGFEDGYPDNLSGGMRQRAAIVRALLAEPRLLLMDEPFGALDALTRETMNLQLSGIAEDSGCAVLLITHSIPEAVLLADRVLVMTPRPGRIADDIGIDLPRPRSARTMADPAFTTLCDRIRRHFHAEGSNAYRGAERHEH